MPVKPSVTPGRTESVGKAIRLLALFRGARAPVRIAEASAATGLARSTTHRLLATLGAEGFVRQDPATRAYYPGAALPDLARSLSREVVLRVAARVGSASAPHATAGGKAILAELPANDIARRHPNERLPRLTNNTIPSQLQLQRALAGVRAAARIAGYFP